MRMSEGEKQQFTGLIEVRVLGFSGLDIFGV